MFCLCRTVVCPESATNEGLLRLPSRLGARIPVTSIWFLLSQFAQLLHNFDPFTLYNFCRIPNLDCGVGFPCSLKGKTTVFFLRTMSFLFIPFVFSGLFLSTSFVLCHNFPAEQVCKSAALLA